VSEQPKPHRFVAQGWPNPAKVCICGLPASAPIHASGVKVEAPTPVRCPDCGQHLMPREGDKGPELPVHGPGINGNRACKGSFYRVSLIPAEAPAVTSEEMEEARYAARLTRTLNMDGGDVMLMARALLVSAAQVSALSARVVELENALADETARHRMIDYGNRQVCDTCAPDHNGHEIRWPCGVVERLRALAPKEASK
jgi:hypothetical protein